MLQAMHRKDSQRRQFGACTSPKPGKQERRPLGVPCVSDRGPQRSAAQVLYAIYERTSCRVRLGTHRALATLNAVIVAGGKVSWMLKRRTYSINSSARESSRRYGHADRFRRL